MGGLSWWHWLVIAAVFIMLFGAKKLPEAARGVGRSLRILKSEVGAMNQSDGAAAVIGAGPAPETAVGQVPSASETVRASG